MAKKKKGSNFPEDARFSTAKKAFVISWIFYSIYVLLVMGFSYILGIKPLVLGLPLWIMVGCILIPVIFVVALVFIAEKFIPDVPLTDKPEDSHGNKAQ